MNELLEAALQYAGRGWRVFPCQPRGKTPLVKTGFKAATVAPSQIEAWWARWPNANIGIATGQVSGLIVLDIDGEKGLVALQRLLALHGGKPLPRTLVCSTGRGWHIYFNLPQGERIPCSKGVGDEEGLDVRADGGYVVAPPSIHPSGAIYRWDTTFAEQPA